MLQKTDAAGLFLERQLREGLFTNTASIKTFSTSVMFLLLSLLMLKMKGLVSR